MREIDIEELNIKFNKIIKKQLPIPSQDDIITFKPLIELILQSEEKIIEKDFYLLKKKYKNNILKYNFLYCKLYIFI